jgi:Family of unknown function (DUF6261)
MKELHVLNLTRLTVLEFGQHIKSVNQGISLLGNTTDPVFINYLATSNLNLVAYDKAMLQIQKSDQTAKIIAADTLRDNAITALQRQLTVYELSEVETEQLAYASLNTLLKNYKGIQRWNFEEESNGIDNLVNDLNNAKYLPSVTVLKMNDFITKIENNNTAFKTIFAGRTQEFASKEVYDVKQLRATAKITYLDMVAYVLAMAKVKNNDEFNKALDVINTLRKYYADLLAKRKPATATTPAVPIPPMAA